MRDQMKSPETGIRGLEKHTTTANIIAPPAAKSNPFLDQERPFGALPTASPPAREPYLLDARRAECYEQLENVPNELKLKFCWLCWKIGKINPATGEFGRVFYYPRSQATRTGVGSENDLERLGSFAEAEETFKRNTTFAGVGVALPDKFEFVALDDYLAASKAETAFEPSKPSVDSVAQGQVADAATAAVKAVRAISIETVQSPPTSTLPELRTELRTALKKNSDNIPAELKQLKNMLNWKTTELNPETGKFNKIPYYPRSRKKRHGVQGSAADKASLGTWSEATAAFNADKNIAGLGFAMLPDFGIVALDVDHCIEDGKLRDDVSHLIDDTYAEKSPSGTGIRAFWRGSASDGKNHEQGFELFHSTGFVTVTGDQIKNNYFLCGGDLPVLDADKRGELESLTRAPGKTDKATESPSPLAAIAELVPDQTLMELRGALLFMDADDRDRWQRMGHALKTLGEAGRALWMDWSETSDKFDRHDANAKWKSFKPSKTGYAAVFAEAQRLGWINPQSLAAREVDKGSQSRAVVPAYSPLPVVQMTCAADIKPEAIRWLWNGWLARGKFHILAGRAGTGKTTIATALAATVSIGGRFPDGTRAPVGNVLIWSGEDSAEDTLVPRLLAAGADTNNIHFVGNVQQGDEKRSFDPATDIQALHDAAAHIGNIAMLIVDPVVNAVAGDSHKNTEVRRALQPLVDLGEKLDCAVLGITHFSKGTGGNNVLERVTGSLAFGALARIVLATGNVIEGKTTKRIFCRAKSNIGVDDGGFEYDFLQSELKDHRGIFASSVQWGDAVEGSARELLAEPDQRESGEHGDSALVDAKAFLLGELAGGAVPTKQIRLDARGAGHSWRTVERAKAELPVKSVKTSSGWHWELPVISARDDFADHPK